MPTPTQKLFEPKSLGILSLSLLTMATGIVSPTIPAIAREYPHVSESLIEQVSTIPSFLMAIFILISGIMVAKIGTKKTVLTGLWLVVISTGLSLIAPNITVLLVARALLGAGLGMYNSLAVSLITVSYSGNKQSKLLGWQNAFQGIGALVGSLLVSALLLISWRASFAIYAVAIVILYLYQRNVPEISMTSSKTKTATSTTQTNWKIIAAAGITLFFLMVAYMIAIVKIPTYLLENHICSTSTSSLLIGLVSLLTIVAGITFGDIYNRLRYWLLPMAAGLMAVSFGMLTFSPTMVTGIISTSLIGLSFGLYVPFIFRVVSDAAAPSQSDIVAKCMMVMSNLANFSSPFFASALSGGNHGTIAIFNGGFIGLVIVLIATIAVGFTSQLTQEEKTEI
ncbi:MFS transporter [Lentilactobacillus sp. Marseille-Q4993]|uniref:MFS transporter n=1 Tax=Lentilactobacillus sp. Marseille-Q4993 TaxID=3039492 RepID=UPI0024BD47C5|nr:MFS transporter [Lentilactobacillus sp. Marseille-Q4993]